MGTLGSVSAALSGRRILLRPREVRRTEMMLRIASVWSEFVEKDERDRKLDHS